MPDTRFDPAEHGWTLSHGRRFPASIAPLWQREADGGVELGFFCEAGHDNGNGAMHGGLVATLADISLGRAVGMHRNADRKPDEPRIVSATIQLAISYCGRVEVGEFVSSRGRVVRATRTLTFAAGELGVGERTIAMMQGVFKLVRDAGG